MIVEMRGAQFETGVVTFRGVECSALRDVVLGDVFYDHHIQNGKRCGARVAATFEPDPA